MRPQEATLTIEPPDWAKTTFKGLTPRLWRALLLYSRGPAGVSSRMRQLRGRTEWRTTCSRPTGRPRGVDGKGSMMRRSYLTILVLASLVAAPGVATAASPPKLRILADVKCLGGSGIGIDLTIKNRGSVSCGSIRTCIC